MEHLFKNLELCAAARLSNINKEIRANRKSNLPIVELKRYRSHTDKLLSAIRTSAKDQKSYDDLKHRFLKPFTGENHDLSKHQQ